MAKKFEYKVVSKNNNFKDEVFVQLGKEGWEMTGILPGTAGVGTIYFKREIESPITQKHEQSGYDMGR